jgi:hypothetical protein
MAKEEKIGQPLGPALPLESVLHKAPNRIYRVGIELEGGWTKLPTGCRGLAHDGSVSIPSESAVSPPLQLGELPSGVLTLMEWAVWLKANYPQKVNQTCGMHVHLSPRTALCYSRLMDPSYPGTVVAYIRRWAEREGLPSDHSMWPRVKGKSIYCQHLYMADDQVRNVTKDHNQGRQGHRYTVINYCHGRYGTVECRLLPMMDSVEQATRLVQEFIDITNGFLRATRRKELRAKVDVEGDHHESYEDLVLEIPRNERRTRVIR